jgi:ATP-dependent protease Clp ATPase subunit
LSIQQELLGRFQAISPFLIGGKRQFDGRGFFFDGRPTGYILGGVFAGLDEIIAKQAGKRGMGFSSQVGEKRHLYILDAIKELGFLDELVNRFSCVIRLPIPRYEHILQAVAGGILNDFNAILAQHDIVLFPEEPASRLIAEYAVESKCFYRGARAVLAMIVEELLFSPKGQAFVIEKADAERAIGRLTSGGFSPDDAGNSVGGSPSQGRHAQETTDEPNRACG